MAARSDRTRLELHQVALTSPTDFGEVYAATFKALDELRSKLDEVPELTFHLSPGTPAMATIWVILSATKFPAELIESSIAARRQDNFYPL